MKRGESRALVPSVRTDYSMSSIVQMHPDVRVSDPTFRPVLLARLFVCVTYPACRSLGRIQSIFKPGPRTPLKESITRDQRTIAQKSLDFNVIHARPMLQWALPRRVIFTRRRAARRTTPDGSKAFIRWPAWWLAARSESLPPSQSSWPGLIRSVSNRWPLIFNEISKDCARPMSHFLH